MSQYNYTGDHTGQSRGREHTRDSQTRSRSATGRGTSGQRPSGRSTSGRSPANRNSSGRGRTGSGRGRQSSAERIQAVSKARRNSSRRGRPDYDYKWIFIGGVILIVVITAVVFLLKGILKSPGTEESESETETTTIEETELTQEVTVDGINITGMAREDAKAEILKNYPWTLTATYEGEAYPVNDLMAEKVDELLQEIYAGAEGDSYTLDTSGLAEKIQAEVDAIGAQLDRPARNGSVSGYDADSDQFQFTGAENGFAIDREKLAAGIQAALEAKEFDAQIAVSGAAVEPEFSEAVAKEKYQTIATFITNTTANSNRNTNIRLAAGLLNGTIVQPGEDFSFNETVGERTAAKGYKGAAAYSNSLVVEEIGGGVCQVSSTLHNAVIKAGLKVSVRRSHTFEPSYVKPGTDAAISWKDPDYKFINNTSAAIGIRASYADQKMTVSIYGVPILEDGEIHRLESRKLRDTDVPAPIYEEDQTLQLDEEKVKTQGSTGSVWETRMIIEKDGVVVSEEVDHTTTYKGHAPVVLRNTSGVVVTTEATGETIESSAPASEGAGDGFVDPIESGDNPSQPTGTGPVGPGVTTAAPTSSSNTTNGPGGNVQPSVSAPTSAATAAATTASPLPTPGTAAVPGSQEGAPGGNSIQTVAPKPDGTLAPGNGPGPGQ